VADHISAPPPLALDVHRLRWLVQQELRQPTSLSGEPSVATSPGGGLLVAWFAAFLPVLFTSDLREELANALEAAGRRVPLPPSSLYLLAARARLDESIEGADPILALVNHHSSGLRQPAYRSLALAVDELRFDDRHLQSRVEHCIREHYVDADHAAVLLLAARGDADEKRRWAAAQLVRHAGHARHLAEVLDGAANCRPVPNTMLAGLLDMALAVSLTLAGSAGSLPFPGAEGTADDWAQRDIVTLGQDLWPRLYLDRMSAHPLFHASIDLAERTLPSDSNDPEPRA
jgi:hypothetical protein